MTEKMEYITASIELLEKRDELNSDELAVLCNLKKFIYQSDHQPTFEVGEYYILSDSLIAKVLKTSEGMCAIRVYSQNEDKFWDDHMAYRSLWGETRKPATAEQIAEFKRAKIKNDIDFIIKDGDGDWIEIVENIEDYFYPVEELREVGNGK